MRNKALIMNYEENEHTEYFIERLNRTIVQNIHQQNFTAQDLARLMNVSTRQFYRNINKHTGQTPHQYLKSYRLSYAHTLLATRRVKSVKAAAYSTGHPNVGYFSKQFKVEFGYLPSELL